MVGFFCAVVIGRFVRNGAALSRNTEPVGVYICCANNCPAIQSTAGAKNPRSTKLSFCHSEGIARRIFALSTLQNYNFYIMLLQRTFTVFRMTTLCFIFIGMMWASYPTMLFLSCTGANAFIHPQKREADSFPYAN